MTARRIPATERLATAVGIVVIGLSVILAVFVTAIRRDLGPPEVVPRGLALGALYATAGTVAILGARRHRPGLVTAAGFACLLGSFLSIATIGFVIPAILLIAIGFRGGVASTRASGARDVLAGAAIAAVVVALIVAGGLSLLGLTETRCWVATGTAANPVYEIVPQGEGISPVGGSSGAFASGCDGGALTLVGVAAEALLLVVGDLAGGGRPTAAAPIPTPVHPPSPPDARRPKGGRVTSPPCPS